MILIYYFYDFHFTIIFIIYHPFQKYFSIYVLLSITQYIKLFISILLLWYVFNDQE